MISDFVRILKQAYRIEFYAKQNSALLHIGSILYAKNTQDERRYSVKDVDTCVRAVHKDLLSSLIILKISKKPLSR